MPQQYTIQSGDTLSGIASRYGLNYKDLAGWNSISNPNMIYAGKTLNLFNPSAQVAPAPVAAVYQPPTPTARTPFSQILPFEKVFDQGLVNQLANSQLQPEIDRQRALDMDTLMRGQAQSGSFRSGRAPVEQQRLNDAYTRQLKEQTAAFTGNVQDWLTDWYNRQYETYNKNPSGFVAPKVPTFEDYMKGNSALSAAYSNYLK